MDICITPTHERLYVKYWHHWVFEDDAVTLNPDADPWTRGTYLLVKNNNKVKKQPFHFSLSLDNNKFRVNTPTWFYYSVNSCSYIQFAAST